MKKKPYVLAFKTSKVHSERHSPQYSKGNHARRTARHRNAALVAVSVLHTVLEWWKGGEDKTKRNVGRLQYRHGDRVSAL